MTWLGSPDAGATILHWVRWLRGCSYVVGWCVVVGGLSWSRGLSWLVGYWVVCGLSVEGGICGLCWLDALSWLDGYCGCVWFVVVTWLNVDYNIKSRLVY